MPLYRVDRLFNIGFVAEPLVNYRNHTTLVALPFPGHSSPLVTLGIAVYNSTEGGKPGVRRTLSTRTPLVRTTSNGRQVTEIPAVATTETSTSPGTPDLSWPLRARLVLPQRIKTQPI